MHKTGLIFLFIVYQISLSKILFSSNFEMGELFIADSVKKGQKSIQVFYGPEWNNWKERNGKGIIIHKSHLIFNDFSYEKKNTRKFKGITGIKDNFPRFSKIAYSGLSEWQERSATIQTIADSRMEGTCFARMNNPKSGIIALTQPLDSLSQVFVEFMISFSKEYLTQQKTCFFHQLLGKGSYDFFIQAGISPENNHCLIITMHVPGNIDTIYSYRPVIADNVYKIHYFLDISEKARLKMWMQERLVADKRYPGYTGAEKIYRLRFINRSPADYDIDAIQVYDSLNPVQQYPLPEFDLQNGKLEIQGPIKVPINVQWRIFGPDRPELPLFLSKPLPIKQNIIPVGQLIDEAGLYYVQARWVDLNFTPGNWGAPKKYSFNAGTDTDNWRIIKDAGIRQSGSKKDVSHIIPGKWYDLRLAIAKEAWRHTISVMLYEKSPDPQKQILFWPVYQENKSMMMNLMLATKGVWVAETQGKRSQKEYTGQKGRLIDAAGKNLIMDETENIIQFRFRLPEDAANGLWVLRAVSNTPYYPQVAKFFTVGPVITGRHFLFKLSAAIIFILSISVITIIRNRRSKRTEPAVSSHYQKIAESVIKRIDLNYNKRIDFDEMAKSVGYTEANLRKIFIKLMAVTPKQHLTNVRLKKAEALLKESADSVNEIAFQVGFGEPTTFIHAFKKKHNMTPAKWREK
jgi:AraC-like DNA-binding protein